MNDDTSRQHKLRSTVTLEYTGSSAPRVTAKGHGEVAEQIIELAVKHNIPPAEDSALNELLCGIELGEEIPAKLYVAVAVVLRFAYDLRPDKFPLDG